MVENYEAYLGELKGFHLFKDIDEEETKKMLKCSKTRAGAYEDQSYIFRQGETPRQLFVLLEGAVMIAKDFHSGKRRRVWRDVPLFGRQKLLV